MILSLVLLLVSVGITAGTFLLGFPFFFLFLFLPIIPFWRSRNEMMICPVCGWMTKGTEKFCPYDGTALKKDDN